MVLQTKGHKPGDPSGHDHHPEHAKLGGAICRSGQDNTENKECRGEDNTRTAADFVYYITEEEHAEYLLAAVSELDLKRVEALSSCLANKVRVRKPSFDSARHAFLVQVGEQRLHVAS